MLVLCDFYLELFGAIVRRFSRYGDHTVCAVPVHALR